MTEDGDEETTGRVTARDAREGRRMTMDKIMAEIAEEAKRLGGGDGYSIDGLLINIEMGVEGLREDEDPPEDMEPVPRRESLLSVAAWAYLAILRHDAAPEGDLDAEPDESPADIAAQLGVSPPDRSQARQPRQDTVPALFAVRFTAQVVPPDRDSLVLRADNEDAEQLVENIRRAGVVTVLCGRAPSEEVSHGR